MPSLDERVDHAPADVLASVRTGDRPRLACLIDEAIARFSGRGPIPHCRYVSDVELLNAALDVTIGEFEEGSHLSLVEFSGGPPPDDSARVLAHVAAEGTLLVRLFERFIGARLEQSRPDRLLVSIQSEAQLVGGLTLAHWARGTLGIATAVTGAYLDAVLSRYEPDRLPGMVGEVLRGRFDENAAGWLRSATIPGFVPGTFGWPCSEPHISPLAVAGASITSRCYWARCAFCMNAGRRAQPLRRLGPSAVSTAAGALVAANVRFVQFFDYALPPASLPGLAVLGRHGISWCGQVRFEAALERPGLFDELRSAGCVGLSWGFESGSSRLLAGNDKGGLSGSARTRLLRAAAEAGIRNHLFVIAGLPGESEGDFAATVFWLANALPWIASGEAHAFQLQVGTQHFERHEELGMQLAPASDWALNIPYFGNPPDEVARARAAILNETLLQAAVLAGSNDWLEGHAPLAGPLPGRP